MKPPLTNNDHDLDVDKPLRLSPGLAKGVIMVVFPALLVLDWSAGSAFSLTLFYLLPVALAAWTFGYRAGLAIAVVSGGYCVFVAMAMHPPREPMAPLAWQAVSTLVLFIVFACAVAYHRAFIDRLIRHARIDVESGALSGREFERTLDAEVRRAKRYGHPLGVIVLEAHGPKQAMGTTRSFAANLGEQLRKNLREGDLVARVGPRRFALLLIECPRVEAMGVAERAREHVVRAFDARISFSLTVAAYGAASPISAAQLLQRIERRLEEVKAGLREGVGFVALA
jgi:GGDEF domain-containing protein